MKSNVRRLLAATVVLGSLIVGTGAASAATAELFAATNGIQPDALAIDGSGNVYASLGQNQTKDIAKITSNGTANLSWKSGLSDYPYELSIGASGSVVAQVGYTSIARFDADGTTLNTYTNLPQLTSVVTDPAGNIWWTSVSGSSVGRIPVGTSSGSAPSGVNLAQGEQPWCVAADAAGNAYLGSPGKVIKFDSSGSRVSPDITVAGVGSGCAISTDSTYGYVTTESGMTGGVARFPLAGGSADATWVTSMSPRPRYLAVGANGNIYTANPAMGQGSSTVSKITPAGAVETIATLTLPPSSLALDSGSNIYFGTMGSFFPVMQAAGVYRIAQAAPAPTPTPTPTPASTPASTPAAGPEVKVTSVPKEIVVEIPSTPGAAPVANVPCEAANGDALQSCTVDMKAPTAALLGQGDGVIVQQARASKTFIAGKATVNAKGGKKRIVVPVKINAKGRTALSRNIRLKVTVGITTVTIAKAKSSGSTETEMQLPRQVLSPQDGIFDTLSTRLNANGRSFVNRLAALLPDAPKAITCTGYADNTGVPGDNRWLGDRRAKTLCAALEAEGIEAKKLRIVSKGATNPRDDNSTAQGRERNRRATVTITY